MDELLLKKRLVSFFMVCLAVLAAISVLQGAKNAIVFKSADFQYDSFKLFSMRINPYDETLSPTGISEKLGLTEYYGCLEANQFPSFLAIMTPFAIFSPNVANIVWCILNLVLTMLMLILLRIQFCPKLPGKLFFMMCCLMLAGLGWRNNIGMGQHTIFSMCFFVLSIYLSEREKPLCAAVALAISYFKYTLTVPLALYFVYKRKFKELLTSIGIHVVLTVFSAFWLDDSVINLVLKPLEITTWLGSEGYIDFGAIFNCQGGVSLIVTAVVMAIYLGVGIFSPQKQQETQVSSHDFLALLCYVAMVVTYHRAYDFFVWIVPCLIYLYRYYTVGQQKLELIASIVLFVYSNFISKLQSMAVLMFPQIADYTHLLDYLLAILTYSFILYLSWCFVRKTPQLSRQCNQIS